MHLYEVLRRPLITEKNTSILQVQNKYAFEVAEKANKPQIKQAVEKAFKVRVSAVNVMTVPGKEQRILISSGGISLIFTGIYTAFISQKREVGSPKNVIEKDIIYVIFIFIYLCLTFYTILFFF